MRILNLYAGVGGNRKLWGDDHEITAVEFDPDIADVYRQLYPNDTVIVADAHSFLLENHQNYDFIWSSPPCPTHSRMRTSLVRSKPVYPDMKLYEEIIFLRHFFRGDWVVENVTPYYKPLIEPSAIVERHYVWSNRTIEDKTFARSYTGAVTDQSKEALALAYGIELPAGTKNQRKLLRNAVLPEMGLYLFETIAKEG